MPTLPLASDVISLTETSLAEPVVSAIIGDAALVVESCIVNYPSTRQTAIIKWVAAHMVQSSGGGRSLLSQKLGDASETYARSALSGEGLKATHFGQQALALDSSGCLSRLGRGAASVRVL